MEKNILSIETSEKICSAAIGNSAELLGEVTINKIHSHNERLAWMVEWLLNEHKLSMDNISHLFISAGPGSYTGLRIGFSFARGLVFPTKTKLVPIPTPEIYAFKNIDANLPIISVMDAHREEIYFAKYYYKNDSLLEEQETQIIHINSFINEYKNAKILLCGSGLKVLLKQTEIEKIKTAWIFKDLAHQNITGGDLYRYSLNIVKNSTLSKYNLEEPLYVRDFKGSY